MRVGKASDTAAGIIEAVAYNYITVDYRCLLCHDVHGATFEIAGQAIDLNMFVGYLVAIDFDYELEIAGKIQPTDVFLVDFEVIIEPRVKLIADELSAGD
jgi:hypothetical protein